MFFSPRRVASCQPSQAKIKSLLAGQAGPALCKQYRVHRLLLHVSPFTFRPSFAYACAGHRGSIIQNMAHALLTALIVASSARQLHGKVFTPEPIGALAAAVVEGVSGYGRYPCTRVAADGSFSAGE